MKTIRMRRFGWGSPDGLRVERFEAGRSYSVPAKLAECFRTAGYADVLGDAPAPEPEPAALAVAVAVAADAPEIAPVVAEALAPKPAAAAAEPRKPAARRPRHLSGAADKSLSAKA